MNDFVYKNGMRTLKRKDLVVHQDDTYSRVSNVYEEVPEFKFALREDLKDHPEFIPTKAEPNATGWDVRASKEVTLFPFEYAIIDLGFRAFCPPGYWLELKPRSSSFIKKHLNCLVGTIDETYEGTMGFLCQFLAPTSLIGQPLKIEFGERIGQLIPVRREEMVATAISNEEIEKLYAERNAVRGAGGFGSSGNK